MFGLLTYTVAFWFAYFDWLLYLCFPVGWCKMEACSLLGVVVDC